MSGYNKPRAVVLWNRKKKYRQGSPPVWYKSAIDSKIRVV